MKSKILIVDDHALVRTAMRLLVLKKYPLVHFEEAENEDECFAKMKLLSFDLVILDLNLPDSDPFNIVQRICDDYPRTKILVVTMNNEEIFGKVFFEFSFSKGIQSKYIVDFDIIYLTDTTDNKTKKIQNT